MTLELRHSTGSNRFDGVTSLVAEDASGSFGLLPGHGRLITALAAGITRFRAGDDQWHYLILPGGILYGTGTAVSICTRRYLYHTDFRQMDRLLAELLRADAEALGGIKESLQRLEQEMVRRLQQLERVIYD